MKKIIILAIAAIIALGANAQSTKSASKNEQTITIQTNGVCQKCADKFKENVPYFKGVKSYSYDMATAKLTITYDSKKTNPDQLRTEVSKLGYNADNVPADPAARAKLPACCRAERSSGGCGNHGNGQGCGNHGNGQGCGNHGNGQGCGNHGNGQGCGNHGNGQGCGNHGSGHGCGNHPSGATKSAASPSDNSSTRPAAPSSTPAPASK